MNRTGRFESGQFLTTGEKALVVMVVAAFLGYWAGFNLSAPGVVMGVPVAATAASMPVAHDQPAHERPATRADGSKNGVAREGTRVSTY